MTHIEDYIIKKPLINNHTFIIILDNYAVNLEVNQRIVNGNLVLSCDLFSRISGYFIVSDPD